VSSLQAAVPLPCPPGAADCPQGTRAGRGALSPTKPTGFLCPGSSSKEIKGPVNRGPPAVGMQHCAASEKRKAGRLKAQGVSRLGAQDSSVVFLPLMQGEYHFFLARSTS